MFPDDFDESQAEPVTQAANESAVLHARLFSLLVFP